MAARARASSSEEARGKLGRVSSVAGRGGSTACSIGEAASGRQQPAAFAVFTACSHGSRARLGHGSEMAAQPSLLLLLPLASLRSSRSSLLLSAESSPFMPRSLLPNCHGCPSLYSRSLIPSTPSILNAIPQFSQGSCRVWVSSGRGMVWRFRAMAGHGLSCRGMAAYAPASCIHIYIIIHYMIIIRNYILNFSFHSKTTTGLFVTKNRSSLRVPLNFRESLATIRFFPNLQLYFSCTENCFNSNLFWSHKSYFGTLVSTI